MIPNLIDGQKKEFTLLEKVVIENIGAEGKSIARVDGMVVFVKEAVPGDEVDLQVFRKKADTWRHAWSGTTATPGKELIPFVSTLEFAGAANGNTFLMSDNCIIRSNRWWTPFAILPE